MYIYLFNILSRILLVTKYYHRIILLSICLHTRHTVLINRNFLSGLYLPFILYFHFYISRYLISHHAIVHDLGRLHPWSWTLFLFAYISIGCFTAIRSSLIDLLNIAFLHQFINCSLHSRHTTLIIPCNCFVRLVTILIFTLTVAQVSVDTLRPERHIIVEDHF